MLGEHLARVEHAVAGETALGDDALALAEQVRQQAAVAHLHLVRLVGQREADRAVAGRAVDAARHHQPAEPEALVGHDLPGRDVGWRDEERDAVRERQHDQPGRAAEQHQRGDHQQQALSLTQTHRGSLPPCPAAGAPRRDRGGPTGWRRGRLRPAAAAAGGAAARTRPPGAAPPTSSAAGGPSSTSGGEAERRPDIGAIAAHREEVAQPRSPPRPSHSGTPSATSPCAAHHPRAGRARQSAFRPAGDRRRQRHLVALARARGYEGVANCRRRGDLMPAGQGQWKRVHDLRGPDRSTVRAGARRGGAGAGRSRRRARGAAGRRGGDRAGARWCGALKGWLGHHQERLRQQFEADNDGAAVVYGRCRPDRRAVARAARPGAPPGVPDGQPDRGRAPRGGRRSAATAAASWRLIPTSISCSCIPTSAPRTSSR